MDWKRRWDPFVWQDENVIVHAVGPTFDDLL